MCNILEVADAAEVIVNGYAFTKAGENVKVLNLNKPEKAASELLIMAHEATKEV